MCEDGNLTYFQILFGELHKNLCCESIWGSIPQTIVVIYVHHSTMTVIDPFGFTVG